MFLSVVIPAYNEAAKIAQDLTVTVAFLEAKPFESEILVVDDGSSDGTSQVVLRYIAEKRPSNVTVHSLSYGGNRGKGFAVRYGVIRAKGEFIAFMDSGLCVPLKYLDAGIEKLQAGADFAIASRRLPGTRIVRKQPLYRRVGSKVFWYVVQIFLGIRVTDSQCGFKIYRGQVGNAIYSQLVTDGFMFDIEALVIAQQLGMKGVEFPVEWANDSDTRYHPFWSTLGAFRELVRIRVRTLLPRPVSRAISANRN